MLGYGQATAPEAHVTLQGGARTTARPQALLGQRFHVMDGLRGIAAIAVVLLHSFEDKGGIPNGQLAVDLFFILSGFVIGFSYDEKLARGMSSGEFLTRRFIRLYPMLWIGALGGAAFAVIHNFTNPGDAYPLMSILVSGGLSMLVLPYFGVGIPSDKAFSFNPPIWSLFFEIVANIAYALFRRWLTVPVLVVLTVGGLIAIGVLGPLDGGSKSNFSWGIPRVMAGFFGGVLLYKLWRADSLPPIRGNLTVLGVLMMAIFAAPFEIGGWIYTPVFAVLWLTVLAAVNAKPSRLDKVSTFLGEASYPVYLVHWLSLYAATFIGTKIGLSGSLYWVVVVLHLAAIPFIGIAFYRFYEQPAMAILKKLLLRPR